METDHKHTYTDATVNWLLLMLRNMTVPFSISHPVPVILSDFYLGIPQFLEANDGVL